MKKILFLSPTGTMDNGAEISIFNLMKYLVEQGYEVVNIAPVSGDVEVNDYSRIFESNGIKCFLVSNQRWWWEDAPGMLFGSEEQRAASFRNTIDLIAKKIDEFDIELVITNTANMFQGAMAAAVQDVSHIWLIHEFPSGEFAYYKDKIEFIEEFSDEIFAVRGELSNNLQELFTRKKIKSFAPYTELEQVSLKKGDVQRIVSVGRINPRKNQLELIKAYHQLNRYDIELVFIGAWDDEYKEKCLDYIKKNRLKNITFLGNVDNPWEHVTSKDICVFSSAMETFGLVYVEALLNGVPVIISNNPGHMSAYDFFNHGCVYPLGDIDKLVEMIRVRLDNFDDFKSETVNFSVEAKEKYQIYYVYQDLIEAIDSVTASPKAIRHIKSLLTLNEKKSKLAQFEYQTRSFLERVNYKIRKSFK